MNDLEKRVRVYNTLLDIVGSFMNQNNISATMMEDALTKVLLQVKEQSSLELINSLMTQDEEEQEEEDK